MPHRNDPRRSRAGRWTIALILISVLTTRAAFGQTRAVPKIDGFLARTYTNARHEVMPYRLFVPIGYDKAKAYPLVIWLHGAGGEGEDNVAQIENDQTLGTHTWTRPEVQAKHPAFVLVPQTVGPWATEAGPSLSDPERLVTEVLASVESEYTVDAKRVYVTGQSNGGYGVWDLITKRPNLFAAAIPICGGGNVSLAYRAANMPIWAFHGDSDKTIPVTESRQMIAAIRKVGGTPRYTEFKGVGHDAWPHAFKEPGLVDWLFAQHQ